MTDRGYDTRFSFDFEMQSASLFVAKDCNDVSISLSIPFRPYIEDVSHVLACFVFAADLLVTPL
jgi:hypothetical protein